MRRASRAAQCNDGTARRAHARALGAGAVKKKVPRPARCLFNCLRLPFAHRHARSEVHGDLPFSMRPAQPPLLRLHDELTSPNHVSLSFRPEHNSYGRYAVVGRRGRDPRKTAGRHLYHLMRSPLTLPAKCLVLEPLRRPSPPPQVRVRARFPASAKAAARRWRRRRRTTAHGDDG